MITKVETKAFKQVAVQTLCFSAKAMHRWYQPGTAAMLQFKDHCLRSHHLPYAPGMVGN